MAKDARISRRELFTGWRKRLTETAAASEQEQQEAERKEVERLETKSLVRENAFQLMDSGKLDAAIDAFRTYIRQELNDDEARMALGSCLYEKGQLVQAKVEFERVLRIRKNDSLASLYLTLALLRLQKFDKVMKVLGLLAAEGVETADPLQGVLVEAHTTLETKGAEAMPVVITVLESRLTETSLMFA